MAETSSRGSRRRFAWAAALPLLAGLASPAGGQPAPETAAVGLAEPKPASPGAPAPGTRVVDYVNALRAAGYDIIYSDALLTPDMRVEAEPPPGDGLARLRAVLAPHGLALRRGPRGAWLVVEAPPDRERPTSRQPEPGPEESPGIESIVVTASRYALERQSVAPEGTLSQTDLTDLPSLGDDALRAARVLPGLTTSGVGAKFHSRGGETDETLLLLDGVRLYDPYHLKDFQSLFSSIGPRMLDSVEVLTGGFPAEFGNRMSAVVEMHSRTPEKRRLYEVGASTLMTSALSAGRFAENRGSWLASLRRGNLDLIADAAESDFGRPTYGDLFGKVGFALDSGPRVTVGSLLVNDRISLRDPGSATAGADYDDGYLWVAVDADRGAKLAVRYLLSHTLLDDGRDGRLDDPNLGTGTLLEKRRFESALLKADGSFAVSARQALRFGAALEDMSARYRFEASAAPAVPIDLAASEPGAAPASIASGPVARSARLALDGQQQGVYLAYRVRPVDRLTVEAGLRWDRQTYLDDSELSPRLNVVLDFGRRGTLRAAWGRFYQPQDVGELQIADGVTQLYPAQQAEHVVAGYERVLARGVTLRVEAYRKELERLRPRFENLYQRVSLLPELLPDRIMIAPTSGEAAGIETALDGQTGAWSWWLALARSSAIDRVDGERVPRSWDEPWSVKAGGRWSGPRWTTTMAATAHAGWPTTALDLVGGSLVAGERNAIRLPTFATLDVKAMRKVELARGSLTWELELQNALDRSNRYSFDYALDFDAAGRAVDIRPELREWLPLIPSFGVLWEFGAR